MAAEKRSTEPEKILSLSVDLVGKKVGITDTDLGKTGDLFSDII